MMMGGSKASSVRFDQISLSNETESIKKQEAKKQVNIVISYIEKNDEQGIGQLVKCFNEQISVLSKLLQ